MSGLIGRKVGMTSVFDADGKNIPCTVIEVQPNVVTQIKTVDTDGYNAVQLAYEDKKEKHTTKQMLGHFKKANTTPKRKIVEFKEFDVNSVKLGEAVNVDFFSNTDWVNVSGVSKGKGFQGVVKRHGFRGVGDATHGQHNRLRAPGSVGASSFPSRVFKGMRMAGRTGGDNVTQQNLQVVKILSDNNVLLVKGSVPGSNGSYLIIKK